MTVGGARRYSDADVARIARIRHLRDFVGLDLNEVGRVQVYGHAAGTVVRCPGCEQVLMKIVRGGGRCWVDMTGVRCLEFVLD